MLFDGASLVLYMVAIIVYITNLVKGLRVVSARAYGTELVEGETEVGSQLGLEHISREDSLRVLSASNTILALVLVGVLCMQAGQWYAERKESQEVAKMDADAAAASASAAESKDKKNGAHGHPHPSTHRSSAKDGSKKKQ